MQGQSYTRHEHSYAKIDEHVQCQPNLQLVNLLWAQEIVWFGWSPRSPWNFMRNWHEDFLLRSLYWMKSWKLDHQRWRERHVWRQNDTTTISKNFRAKIRNSYLGNTKIWSRSQGVHEKWSNLYIYNLFIHFIYSLRYQGPKKCLISEQN